MSDYIEFEWIEPTQEHVGQMIEVRDDESKAWKPAKLTGILADEYKFAAKTDEYGSLSWKHARIARPLTYVERQARCGLKVGDRVKFVRAWEGNESGDTTEFVHSMEPYVGKIGSITSMSKSSCCVHFNGDGCWYFPYFVLEKVDPPQSKEKIRTVAELEVGEIIQIASNHWLQIMPFDNQLCSWQSNLSNDFDGGWVPDRTLKPGNRPAKELYCPDFSHQDIGKLAVYTNNLKDRFFISGVYCEESSGCVRNVILRSVANGKRVIAPLSDVRVIS